MDLDSTPPDFTSLEDCKNACANNKTCEAFVWLETGSTSRAGCRFNDGACVIETEVGAVVYEKN